MDFSRSENHTMIKNMVDEFAKNEIEPGAIDRDENCTFPLEICRKLGELGLMGIMVPEEYGGSAMDVTSFATVVEAIARYDGSTALSVQAHNGLSCGHILTAGSEDLKKRYLPDMASGQKLGAWGLTEPGSGSDASSMKTTAVKKGDRWIINGSKNFITHGTYGDVYIIMANTDPEKGNKGITAFVAEKGWDGLIIGKKENKLGMRASDTTSLTFDNLEVPEENIIGEVNMGFVDTMKILDRGRAVIAALALGLGRAALEESIAYAKEREAFGKAIKDFQAIQWMIADSFTELQAAKVLVDKACWMHDQKMYAKKESSQAKLLASEVARKVCHRAVQIHGGYGYVTEYPVERYWRDTKLCEIGEGTSEIQREIIFGEVAKEMGV